MSKRMSGWTLVEGLASLAIIAIIVGFSASVKDAVGRGAALAAQRQLLHPLQFARTLAITRQAEVTLCGSSDGSSCHRSWDAGADVLVFLDANQNRRLDAGESLELSVPGPRGRVRWRGSGGRHYQRFRPDGSAIEFGSYFFCPASLDTRFARQVTLNFNGRPYLSMDKDGDGYHEDNRNGSALGCEL